MLRAIVTPPSGMLCDWCRFGAWRASRALYGWWDWDCTHPQRRATWPAAGAATECEGYTTIMSKFDQALHYVFEIEGRFSDRKNDRGGPTMFGVTQDTYDRWRAAKALPKASVAQISRIDATQIYREWYWDIGGCELLPPVLAICAFDAMVNHRPQDAIAIMQRALGVPADGVLGPLTRAAYSRAADNPGAIWKFVSARLDLYCDIVRNDQTQLDNLKGWLRRAHALERLLM
jgi:lysozyme family protein